MKILSINQKYSDFLMSKNTLFANWFNYRILIKNISKIGTNQTLNFHYMEHLLEIPKTFSLTLRIRICIFII